MSIYNPHSAYMYACMWVHINICMHIYVSIDMHVCVYSHDRVNFSDFESCNFCYLFTYFS